MQYIFRTFVKRLDFMQVRTFVIPLLEPKTAEEELNKFLRSQRVITIDRQFCGAEIGWAVLVQYMDGESAANPDIGRGRETKDFSKILDPEVYERFSALRKIRAEIAKEKGYPPYLIYTNDELAILAKFSRLTPEVLSGIKDIPRRRIDDYGEEFIRRSNADEKSEPLDGTDLPY